MESIKITFEKPDGTHQEVDAPLGSSLLEVAHGSGLYELEGACEGSLACSTCHVILDQKVFDILPEATDDENDMLDLAFGLTETSRLGCQVIVTPELEGMLVKIPSESRNFSNKETS
jgi:ferredoxin